LKLDGCRIIFFDFVINIAMFNCVSFECRESGVLVGRPASVNCLFCATSGRTAEVNATDTVAALILFLAFSEKMPN